MKKFKNCLKAKDHQTETPAPLEALQRAFRLL